MVRGERIKSYTFPAFNVTGSVLTPVHTTQSLNGEILKVRFTNTTSPGSFWLVGSATTGVEIFRKNNITSGTTPVDYYPVTYASVNTANGGPAVGSPVTKAVIDEPLFLAASGLTSGASKTFGPITVYYR